MADLRFCLWGGRRRDVQVGSELDREVQRHRSALMRQSRALRRAFQNALPSVREVAAAFERMAAAAIPASEACRRIAAGVKRMEENAS